MMDMLGGFSRPIILVFVICVIICGLADLFIMLLVVIPYGDSFWLGFYFQLS